MEVRVWTKKGIDEVELRAIYLFKKKLAGNLTCGPPILVVLGLFLSCYGEVM